MTAETRNAEAFDREYDVRREWQSGVQALGGKRVQIRMAKEAKLDACRSRYRFVPSILKCSQADLERSKAKLTDFNLKQHIALSCIPPNSYFFLKNPCSVPCPPFFPPPPPPPAPPPPPIPADAAVFGGGAILTPPELFRLSSFMAGLVGFATSSSSSPE